jgi:hypothetical protein
MERPVGRADAALRGHRPGGGLFPVPDADLKLAPDGESGTVLSLADSYRPPLGSLGEALDRTILRRVAAATIRSFVAEVAAQINGNWFAPYS